MTCLDKVNADYVVSGGVDGYIFIWNVQLHHCVKVIKCN